MQVSPALPSTATAYVESADADISILNDQIYAVDTATGNLKWARTIGRRTSSPLTVAGGIIYVTTQHRMVYAVDAATGNLKWSYTLPEIAWSSPTVAGGLVYVGANNILYALNAATGAHVWHYNGSGNLLSSAAVYGGLVYAWFGGNLYALDADNGAFKWIHWTNYKNDQYPPIVANATIIAMGHGTIDALNSADGSYSQRHHLLDGRSYFASINPRTVETLKIRIPKSLMGDLKVARDTRNNLAAENRISHPSGNTGIDQARQPFR